jgi:hypothetical protein
LIVNEQRIFLIDGFGALVSVIILAVLLPAYQALIGMPAHILYLLSLAPAAYFIYDAYCFFRVDHRNPKWLRTIILANSLYCCTTALLVVGYFSEMTIWGVTYFIGELCVILGLVVYQTKLFLRIFGTGDHKL